MVRRRVVREWGVRCGDGWYEALRGVPMPFTREEAEQMRDRVNRDGRGGARVEKLPPEFVL
jgi:hypothetical protein